MVASALIPICEVAHGGLGFVVLAVRREGSFRRLYAVKRLHAHLRTDPGVRTMFRDEARLSGLLRHPNVVSVLDVGEDAEGTFLVMDYIDGVSVAAMLDEVLAGGEPLPLQLCLSVCLDAARGLHAAHELAGPGGAPLGLVHRDVSPNNILLGFDGTARVSDFGIAKAFGNATKSSIGVLKGSGGYMSPEQLRFEEPDRRSDLFSLGVVLYEMLAGGPLYVATPGPEAARRILTEAPPDIGELRDDVPAPLTELLFRLLAKDKDLRPSTAAEVATALEAVLVTLLQDEARLDVAGYLGRRFGARRLSQRPEVVAALETPPPSSSTTRSEPPTARRRRWLALAPLAVLAGAAATFGLWRARPLSGPRPSPTAPAAVASQVAGAAVAPARTLWAGSWHTCAKKGGSLSCWGKNNDGQLGNGQSLDSVIPASVQPEIMGVVDADGGDFHTCALDGEGQAHCFGSNLRGALGLGQQGDSLLRHEVAGTQRFIDLDAGDRHTCGVTRAGTVSCWGSNGSGQVGDGTTTDRLAPTDVPGLAVVREVSAGGDSTCALAAAGLYCWGAPLREGANSASSPRPVLVAGAGDVSQVSVGRGFACLRRLDGKVACWGANAYGQLGDGTTVGRASPRDVAGDDRFVHVSAGGSFACALQADGRVRCWGRNHWGNLGTGSDEDLAVPTLVVDLATVTEVAAGRVHACARLRGGGVACWGHNDTGQVGDGTRGKDRLRPVTVPGPD